MGTTCGKGSQVDVYISSSTKDKRKFSPPGPLTCISGVDVDRDSALYQYGLFCTTRLMDRYKEYMFPHVTMSLGSFREDLRDYLDVIEEVYHDLDFEERILTNGRVSFEADCSAKEAVSQLAFWFWSRAKAVEEARLRRPADWRPEPEGAETAPETDKDTRVPGDLVDAPSSPGHGQCSSEELKDLHIEYDRIKDTLQDEQSYKYCYDDTLKMLITDLERKEIWQPSTLYSNEAFCEYLKEQEPVVYRELNDESVTIVVPKPLQRKELPMCSSDEDD